MATLTTGYATQGMQPAAGVLAAVAPAAGVLAAVAPAVAAAAVAAGQCWWPCLQTCIMQGQLRRLLLHLQVNALRGVTKQKNNLV
jgi:hypothetical protein